MEHTTTHTKDTTTTDIQETSQFEGHPSRDVSSMSTDTQDTSWHVPSMSTDTQDTSWDVVSTSLIDTDTVATSPTAHKTSPACPRDSRGLTLTGC